MTGPQIDDAGIGADGQEYIYEPDGWVPVTEPVRQPAPPEPDWAGPGFTTPYTEPEAG